MICWQLKEQRSKQWCCPQVRSWVYSPLGALAIEAARQSKRVDFFLTMHIHLFWPKMNRNTVLNLVLHKKINFEKLALFWWRSSIAPYIHVMRICKMLISYVRLDHTLYWINYGRTFSCSNDVQGMKQALLCNRSYDEQWRWSGIKCAIHSNTNDQKSLDRRLWTSWAKFLKVENRSGMSASTQ